MNSQSIFVIVSVILLAAIPCLAETFSGRLVKVTDGDTVQVLHNGKAEKIRLVGIDCPEKSQPFGQSAKRLVLNLAAQKTVTILVAGKDRYGRTLGTVILPDVRYLNEELIRAGLAWHYKRYSKDETLAALENEARSAKRGLWGEPNPIAPWSWRRGKRKAAMPQEPLVRSPSPSRLGTCQYQHKHKGGTQ
jgi:endonuclease YncB( thermonuclease family)